MMKMPGIRTMALFLLAAGLLPACERTPETAATETPAEESVRPPAEAAPNTFSYTLYDALLGTYVDARGQVDYAGLQANRADLDAFVETLGAIDPAAFAAWPEDERLALWINAYNAITLKYIIDHYPIQKGGLIASLRHPENSIRQIPGVWDKLTATVAGKAYTLDAIEHDIVRVRFQEPRIHTAVNCASKGCPPLRNEAFIAARLEAQLADQSRTFLSDEKQFRIDREKGRVYVSRTFDWFGKDFVKSYGDDERFKSHGRVKGAVMSFISRYVSAEDARYLAEEDYSIRYQDYDWSLNEQGT